MIERPKSSPEPASAKEPVVFVIDDDASMRRALTNLFQSVGLAVEVFGSASEMLQAKLPDVASCLVLDIRLPGLSGRSRSCRTISSRSALPAYSEVF